jgi:hypothetical protein
MYIAQMPLGSFYFFVTENKKGVDLLFYQFFEGEKLDPKKIFYFSFFKIYFFDFYFSKLFLLKFY